MSLVILFLQLALALKCPLLLVANGAAKTIRLSSIGAVPAVTIAEYNQCATNSSHKDFDFSRTDSYRTVIFFGDSTMRQLFFCYSYLCNATDDTAKQNCYGYAPIHEHLTYHCGKLRILFRWTPLWYHISSDPFFRSLLTKHFSAQYFVSALWHYNSLTHWVTDFESFVSRFRCNETFGLNFYFQYGNSSLIDWLAAIGYAKIRLMQLNCSTIDATAISHAVAPRMRDELHYFGDATIGLVLQTIAQYAKF
jgi:hypothetical protein